MVFIFNEQEFRKLGSASWFHSKPNSYDKTPKKIHTVIMNYNYKQKEFNIFMSNWRIHGNKIQIMK
jgi:hypothetical protein